MRLVLFLAVAAAATVMAGALLMAASVVLRHATRHPPVPPAHLARIGLYVIAAGIAFGLVVLVLFAVGRLGRSRRSKPEATVPGHRQEAPRPQTPEPHGHARPAGHGAARSSRRPVNPTNVYTPGGLIDVPRDGHAPGTPGGPPIPEILRTAGPVPHGPLPGGQVPGSPGPGGAELAPEAHPAGEARTGRHLAGPDPRRRAPATSPG